MALTGYKLPDDEQEKYKDGGLSRCVIRPERYVTKSFWFQGPDEEIIRLLDYLEQTENYRLTQKKVDTYISKVWIPPMVKTELIQKFPILKATGFALELTKSGEICMADVLYKESGSCYVTKMKQITPHYVDLGSSFEQCNHDKNVGICWPDCKDPCEAFKTRYMNWNPRNTRSSTNVVVDYEFPFQQEWEDGVYVYEHNGEFYQFDAKGRYEIEDQVLIRTENLQKSIGIPSEVRVIGKGAFRDNKEINRVTLSELDEIQDEAFAYCSNLRHVAFKSGLKRIGAEAFADCEHLAELIIPDSVTEIVPDAFFRCGVERLVWPKGVTEIPTGMFKECRNLYEITIPPEVTVIGRRVFNRSNTIIVCGAAGSTAESYAKSNGLFFKEIERKS